uniref:tectonic-1-like n=1 Tax=Myxine glutinosa TaxID=7769 RepID=UPI00359027BD
MWIRFELTFHTFLIITSLAAHGLFTGLFGNAQQDALLCECDLLHNECDPQCCCDVECGVAVKETFMSCNPPKRGVDTSHCTYTSIDNRSMVSSRLFCVEKDNYPQGGKYGGTSPPINIPEFRSLLALHHVESWVLPTSTSHRPATSYKSGIPVLVCLPGALKPTRMQVPTAVGSSVCLNSAPTGFLIDRSSTCLRPLVDLVSSCNTSSALSLVSFTNMSIVRNPGNFTSCSNAGDLVAVQLSHPILLSAQGFLSSASTDNALDFEPTPHLGHCLYTVLELHYILMVGSEGVLGATVSAVLGSVPLNATSLWQHFSVRYSMGDQQLKRRLSGNPGYIIGQPVVGAYSGRNGSVSLLLPPVGLSVAAPPPPGNCELAATSRRTVNFKEDTRGGCVIRSPPASCRLLLQMVCLALFGNQPPNLIARFGNSLPSHLHDWLPVPINQVECYARAEASAVGKCDKTGCILPLTADLRLLWDRVGSLGNPQLKLLEASVHHGPSECIALNTSWQPLLVTTTVTFIEIARQAAPAYRVAPQLDVRLPSDLFFPFMQSWAEKQMGSRSVVVLAIFLYVMVTHRRG